MLSKILDTQPKIRMIELWDNKVKFVLINSDGTLGAHISGILSSNEDSKELLVKSKGFFINPTSLEIADVLKQPKMPIDKRIYTTNLAIHRWDTINFIWENNGIRIRLEKALSVI